MSTLQSFDNTYRLSYASSHQEQAQSTANILHDPPIVYGNSSISSSTTTPPPYYYSPHPYTTTTENYPYSPYHPQNATFYTIPTTQMMPYYTTTTAEMMIPSQQQILSSSPPSSASITSSSTNQSPRTPPIMVNPLPHRSTTEEIIAKVDSAPVEFFETEFFEYPTSSSTTSKKDKTCSASKKRKRDNSVAQDETGVGKTTTTKFRKFNPKELSAAEEQDEEDNDDLLDNNELRRQVHIQSEQKRRAQIKDGFEVLKSHLPGCVNKKLSKAALLTRTVQQLQHMKKMQSELLAEVERLAEENLNLKRKYPDALILPPSTPSVVVLAQEQNSY